ncbi:MAG TPA: long-chain-fatty-acid--CoA ligase [Piscinibacter sp.]|jgi:long-chain acyl-CoA synthetase|uniref:long-chain-fatty-acid--CoA ligase n=1 Tax=Piscinibacter sp. TaxID=1903157 RepID=UPI001B6361D5|nr:long-chain-fatty-acid--CoA ligase [Piscinibacter sp.]MBP5990258.1 long-chain-fatty-acid--CoA ligase [Piscinibacter sp.]MBP6027650.1 long-chain-fatty-acid--CoA ligase [Piscinibacter sp.]HNK18436.1 long-chain-fatty-acid--CoA ligase [Piscinibacter sp.]
MEKIWLKQYPAGVPANIDVDQYPSLVALLEDSLKKYASLPAYKFMGKAISFAQLDQASRALAAYLQSLGLAKGDRVAIMLPNIPQYPVAVAAVLRAGYVVVNVNPLYTPRELEHQLKDSGAKAILIVENFAHVLQQVMSAVPTKKVILTALGDMLGFPKSLIVNYVVRKVKKMVPAYELPGAVRFNDALSQGAGKTFTPAPVGPDDIAVLQYTGGTTGVSKGAVLLHRCLVANILQSEAWYQPALKKIPKGEQIVTVCALPLYHIFGFNTNMMLSMRMGGCNILIANPRDLPAMFKDLAREKFHSFPAVNTLFMAMANHAEFGTVDWSSLVISVGGGMAVQSATAKLWLEKTGCPIVEGYGLSETSPSATCNPVDSTAFSGNIGLPMPNTELTLLDDDGREVGPGQAGEIAIRGPQVMAGYWQRPDETAKVMTADGFFRTGDVGMVDERGYFRIVDRKKDMILVSGFNVYPNEVEDVMTQMDGILECAAVGIPDEKAGEAVKLVIVKKNPAVTEADVRAFCEANLTGYKRPKVVEFRTELPKTPVGKILRRELRGK